MPRGIACSSESNGPRHCIAVFDEGGEARHAIIDGERLIPQPERIVLLTGNGELDAAEPLRCAFPRHSRRGSITVTV